MAAERAESDGENFEHAYKVRPQVRIDTLRESIELGPLLTGLGTVVREVTALS